jgi:hypothetical protein
MSSKCSGQFSQMGSQRLLLLFRKDAHIRITTRPACTMQTRCQQISPHTVHSCAPERPCSTESPVSDTLVRLQGLYPSGNINSDCNVETWAMLAWLGGLSGKQVLR